jgi:arylsulfatase A-like enzyme
MRATQRLAGLVAWAIACGGDTAPPPREASLGPDRVIARIGSGARPALVEPAVRAAPRKLGVRTRNAIHGGAALRLEVPADATRLLFSLACVTPEAAGCRATFRIDSSAAGGPWQPLARGDAPDDGSWQDRETELPDAAGGLRLRFSAEVAADGGAEALWGSLLLLGPDGEPARPNVVLISLDTLGAASLGSFSGEAGVSPHLDAFLAGGASFRRAYAQYGNTLVSHASLFSALHPLHHGVYPDRVPTLLSVSLVEALSAAGYRATAFTEGAFVSAAFGFATGFDAYDDGAIGISRQMAGGAHQTFERAAGFLEKEGSRERFFLFVHTYEVHSPYLPRGPAEQQIADRLTPGDRRVPARETQARQLLRHNAGHETLSPRDLARLAALHVGEVHGLDAVVGRFLARLDATGLGDDTLVVITSDHGDQFGEAGKVGHGDSLHSRVLHVPLGFRWPGVIAPRQIEAPVQLVDVMPTVLALAGVAAPARLDGISLAGVLTGDAPAPNRPAFAEQRSGRGECARLGLELGCRLDRLAVYSGAWKLVSSQLPPWRRLYDLSRDPEEQHDVADAQPEQAERLSSLLDGYRESASAPPDGVPDLDADTRQRLRDLGYAIPDEATSERPPR